MAIVGPVTRAALHRFEGDDLVEEVRVHHDRVRVQFKTGVREVWGLLGEKSRRLTLPTGGWWRHKLIDGLEFGTFRQLDLDYRREDDPFFLISGKDLDCAGFLERRLAIHGIVARLLHEGWIWPSFPGDALHEDLASLRSDSRRFTVTPGYIRGQPGRAPSPLPGLLLANHLRDWGPLRAPGRPTLSEAWAHPRRLYWAVNTLVEKGQDVTRAGIIHRLVCGQAKGFPMKVGPRWKDPALLRSILKDVVGLGHRPVVLDRDPGCGSLAVATASLQGIYITPTIEVCAPQVTQWAETIGAEVIEDTGDVTADVVFVDVADVEGLVAQVETVGRRCACVVANLPSGDGVRQALPGVDVIRYRPRPYRRDEVLVVWHQS